MKRTERSNVKSSMENETNPDACGGLWTPRARTKYPGLFCESNGWKKCRTYFDIFVRL